MRSVFTPVCHSSVRSEAAPFLRPDQHCRSRRAQRSSRATGWPARSSFTLDGREHGGTLVFFRDSRLQDRGGLPFAVLMVAPTANELNRILSRLFAFLSVGSWEQRKTDHGRQGKSAAFGRAHVVGGVEVLRGTRNDQAVAPFQIVKELNGAGAVGLRKFAVKPS